MSAKVNHTLTESVLDLLRRSNVKERSITLPRNLCREDYLAVNKALELLGCEWNRGAQCHTVAYGTEGDLRARVGLALDSGEITDLKKFYQAYYTPPGLATAVALRADVAGQYVLEPNVGGGALAQACRDAGAAHVLCLDLNPAVIKSLTGRFPLLAEADFLSVPCVPASVTRVVMNPPFTRGQDRAHVAWATQFLAPGGKLVAIVMGSAEANNECSKWVKSLHLGADLDYEFWPVPPGSFAESGTEVDTSILTIQV